MRRVVQSVRWRLQLWHALILLGVIIALCLVVYHVAAEERLRRVDRDLKGFERTMFRYLLGNPGGKEMPSPATVRERLRNLRPEDTMPAAVLALFHDNESTDPYFVAWDGDGSVLFRSANAPAGLVRPPVPDEGGELSRDIGGRHELFRFIPHSMSSVIGREIGRESDDLSRLVWLLILSGGGVWLLGLLGGWWLAGRAIQPIDSIAGTASRIAGGNLAERINVTGTDNELGRLSQVLNDTFDRLESAIHRQKQFTADASHELRTPISVILCEAQRGLKRERTPEEYREILATCHHASERMRTLVESLLTLARQDGDPDAHVVGACDLKALVAESIGLLQPLADQSSIGITADLESVPLVADARGLALVIANLLSNAIHHQPPGGSVHVQVAKENDKAVLRVADTGPGILPEHLPRLFDRFYRVDKARGSAGAHSGLGLAIVRAVVERHHGTVAVESVPGEGTVFTVVLPVG